MKTYNLLFTVLAFIMTFNQIRAQISPGDFNNNSESFELDIQDIFYVYPNPFTEYTNIHFTSEEKTTYRMHVTNSMGQQVMFLSGPVAIGDNTIQVMRSGLQEGRYFFRITYGRGKMKTGRLYIWE